MSELTRTSSVPDTRPLNAITIDVEDWLQSTVDSRLPLTDHFYANTHKVLAALADRQTRGTFFVLGLAAEQAPGLVREIQAAGHEVQSHGYGHELLHELTPAQFRADLERSKKLLEDITGREICGYRAPAFTITRRTLWALDVLAETGFRYDSSVFPLRTPRYGIEGAPYYPHLLRTPAGHEIREFPVASYRCAGRRIPIGGGGYVRLFPYFVLQRGIRQLNAEHRAATIYMHPYEYNPGEFQELDQSISWKMRLHQGLGRGRFPRRIDRLLAEFRFGPICDVLASITSWPTHEHAAQPV
jgi:polysaccharide deacetylase family protein (PEP-CTERM system associated)